LDTCFGRAGGIYHRQPDSELLQTEVKEKRRGENSGLFVSSLQSRHTLATGKKGKRAEIRPIDRVVEFELIGQTPRRKKKKKATGCVAASRMPDSIIPRSTWDEKKKEGRLDFSAGRNASSFVSNVGHMREKGEKRDRAAPWYRRLSP